MLVYCDAMTPFKSKCSLEKAISYLHYISQSSRLVYPYVRLPLGSAS